MASTKDRRSRVWKTAKPGVQALSPWHRCGSATRRDQFLPDADVALVLRHVDRGVFSRFFGKDPNPQPLRPEYWARWELDYIHQVSAQGTPIEPSAGWRRRIPNPEEQALALLGVVIGFIPIVGDAADIAELLYGWWPARPSRATR